MVEVRVKTPCIGVCSTGIGDRVCRGCKRFSHEVVNWNTYTNEQKLLIEERLAEFLSRCVQNKLRVNDAETLREQLQVQQIAFPEARDEYCWAYCLIKAGGSQISQPEDFGITVDAEYRDMGLDELRRIIDEEYYILSDAYYERYISAQEIA